MGANESTIILDFVGIAEEYTTAYRRGTQHQIVNDASFIGRFVDACKKLPQDLRSQIKQHREPAEKKASEKRIEFPTSVAKAIPHWKSNIHTFFAGPITAQPDFDHNPLGEAYKRALQLNERLEIDRIRLHMYRITFYRVQKKLGIRRLDENARTRLAKIFNASGTLGNNDEICHNLIRWMPVGKKLDELCRRLKVGILSRKSVPDKNPDDNALKNLDGNRHLAFIFALPERFSENYLDKLLPTKGKKLDCTIDELVAGGIFTAIPDDLFTITNDVFDYLWGKIETALSLETQASMSELIWTAPHWTVTSHKTHNGSTRLGSSTERHTRPIVRPNWTRSSLETSSETTSDLSDDGMETDQTTITEGSDHSSGDGTEATQTAITEPEQHCTLAGQSIWNSRAQAAHPFSPASDHTCNNGEETDHITITEDLELPTNLVIQTTDPNATHQHHRKRQNASRDALRKRRRYSMDSLSLMHRTILSSVGEDSGSITSQDWNKNAAPPTSQFYTGIQSGVSAAIEASNVQDTADSRGAWNYLTSPVQQYVSNSSRESFDTSRTVEGTSYGTGFDNTAEALSMFQLPENNDISAWSRSIDGPAQPGQLFDDITSYHLPQNADMSAWSNVVGYFLPQIEDQDAWAGLDTYRLPQNMDQNAWSNHMTNI